MNRILLIEVDAGTEAFYRQRSSAMGDQVVVVPSTALDASPGSAAGFDLILVGAQPGGGIDSLEICRRLRSVPEAVATPIVLLRGEQASNDALRRAHAAGAQAVARAGDTAVLEDVTRAMLRLAELEGELGVARETRAEETRRAETARARAAELEAALGQSDARSAGPREFAVARPDGVLLVDTEGVVRMTDRGARDLLGSNLEGKNMGLLSPNSGL